MNARNSAARARVDRRGVAATEFALVAPLLVFAILGVLEIGRAIQVQMALTNAVREGCRAYCENTATVTLNGQTYQTGTQSYAIAVAKYVLQNANVGVTAGNINSVTVTALQDTAPVTAPGTTYSLTRGTVTITMPYSLIAYSPPFILGSKNLTASMTMRKP
jgi:Flp pilus assembly protein TadG